MNDHLNHLERREGEALKEGAITAEMITFYRMLYDYQRGEYERYGVSAGIPALGPEDLPIPSMGKSVLLREGTWRLLIPGLDPLVEIVSTQHPGLELAPLRDALTKGPDMWIDIASAIFDRDPDALKRHALAHSAGTDELLFLMINWLRPFMVRLRETYGEQISEDDTMNSCPFCGYFPEISLILGIKEGKRHLSCSLCECLWPYKRIACSVCGMEDAKQLEYLTAEGNDRHRIDLCHECHGYIKTVRLVKFEEPEECDPAVENILTVHLDSAALKRGFHRP